MNIIEKLGITPGPWEAELLNDESDSTRINGAEFCSDNSWFEDEFSEKFQLQIHRNAQLIAAAPEMLEDGIENCELIRKMYECRFEPDKVEIYFRRMKTNSYEKATGKTWEEIKELMEK